MIILEKKLKLQTVVHNISAMLCTCFENLKKELIWSFFRLKVEDTNEFLLLEAGN